MERIFGENRIVALSGEKSSGKTNNLISLIELFRQKNKETPIYIYGLDKSSLEWLKKFEKIYEISMLKQLSNKKDCLIVVDEFQRLRLNDRRNKEILDNLIDFIYHKNNWIIFSSPNLREFNSVIGSKIEGWCLKSLNEENLINGSQLKKIVQKYNGRFKSLGRINLKKNQLLIINDDYEKMIELDYIEEVDKKKNNKNIFKISK